MKYQIVDVGGKTRLPLEAYATIKLAQQKLTKYYKARTIKIIAVPDEADVYVGMLLTRPDGTTYGEVLGGTENFWNILRYSDNQEAIFLKDDFDKKFINEIFIMQPYPINIKEEGETMSDES